MSGSLRDAWEHIVTELWEPLANYSFNDMIAPEDLFSDLFVTADEYLSPRPTDIDLEESRHDPDKASQRFLALKGTDFTSEYAIVQFLEEAYDVIADYGIVGFEDLYRRLMQNTIRKFNLRYRLDDPFTLFFLLPSSFTNLYRELQHVNAGDTHLISLFTDFEKSFNRYTRTQDPTDLKRCIANASIYTEGLASVAAGIPETRNTLGALCDQIGNWPHNEVKEALQKLYGFCSDYPGIRHAGHPASALRDLASYDMILVCLLLMSFSGYLLPTLDGQVILGI